MRDQGIEMDVDYVNLRLAVKEEEEEQSDPDFGRLTLLSFLETRSYSSCSA